MPALTNSDVINNWYNGVARETHTPNHNLRAENGRLYSFGVLVGLTDVTGVRWVLPLYISATSANHINAARSMRGVRTVDTQDMASGRAILADANLSPLVGDNTRLGVIVSYRSTFPIAMLSRVLLGASYVAPPYVAPVDTQYADLYARLVRFRGTMLLSSTYDR